MQALLDFLPVIAFVLTYWVTGDMSSAIAVIMVAVTLQVLMTWVIKREVNKMLLASAALVIVLGGVSLFLDNPLFFKWKPTGLYWLFALAFLISQFVGKQPLVKRMMESVAQDDFDLPDKVWNQMNLAWVAFFVISGSANIYVAYNYEEATWVNFKLFGLFGMTFVFMVGQAFWLSHYMSDTDENTEEGDS